MKNNVFVSLICSVLVNVIYILLKYLFGCYYYDEAVICSLVISLIMVIYVVNNKKIKKNNIVFIILFNIFNYIIIWLMEYIPYPVINFIYYCDTGMAFSGFGYAIYFYYLLLLSFSVLIISGLIKLLIIIFNRYFSLKK